MILFDHNVIIFSVDTTSAFALGHISQLYTIFCKRAPNITPEPVPDIP